MRAPTRQQPSPPRYDPLRSTPHTNVQELAAFDRLPLQVRRELRQAPYPISAVETEQLMRNPLHAIQLIRDAVHEIHRAFISKGIAVPLPLPPPLPDRPIKLPQRRYMP